MRDRSLVTRDDWCGTSGSTLRAVAPSEGCSLALCPCAPSSRGMCIRIRLYQILPRLQVLCQRPQPTATVVPLRLQV